MQPTWKLFEARDPCDAQVAWSVRSPCQIGEDLREGHCGGELLVELLECWGRGQGVLPRHVCNARLRRQGR